MRLHKGKYKSHGFSRCCTCYSKSDAEEINGENIFQGRIIEVHIGTLLSDQAFTFTGWTAEMKAKASICISAPLFNL